MAAKFSRPAALELIWKSQFLSIHRFAARPEGRFCSSHQLLPPLAMLVLRVCCRSWLHLEPPNSRPLATPPGLSIATLSSLISRQSFELVPVDIHLFYLIQQTFI